MKFALVGASGYGFGYYLRMLDERIPHGLESLTGIVDPFAEACPWYERLKALGIPFYDTLEAFYRDRSADLVFIASPVPFHKEQAICAIEHGSWALCEKPLAARLQDVDEIRQRLGDRVRRLGVGFQWSFSECMLSLKRDILAGLYGKPVMLKTFASMPRPDAYYSAGGWKGRLKDARGNWVLDSVLTNAASHYLHNMLFVLGERLDLAAMPDTVSGSVYRGKPIESYDTCFLRGTFPGGGAFWFGATHASERNDGPRFEYVFERGTVSFDPNVDDRAVGRPDHGETRIYGCPRSDAGIEEKILRMAAAAAAGETPVCHAETILPHLTVSNGVADHLPIRDFPPEVRVHQAEPKADWVRDLHADAERCYAAAKLPDEMGLAWAAPSVTFRTADVKRFEGRLL